MKNKCYDDISVEILGIFWWPGIVLVGCESASQKDAFIIGNCIAQGLKGDIPIAYFTRRGYASNIYRTLDKMSEEKIISRNGYPMNWHKDYRLTIDTTSNLTIAYLVERIFYLAETEDIRMVIVDPVQIIDGSIFSRDYWETPMVDVIRVLSSLAHALDIIVIVTSERHYWYWRDNYERQTLRDFLGVPPQMSEYDQIVLIQSDKLILPKGPFTGRESSELIINIEMDEDKGCWKMAERLAKKEEEEISIAGEEMPDEDPMYTWYEAERTGSLYFDFYGPEPDSSDYTEWTIQIELHGPNSKVWLYHKYQYPDPGEVLLDFDTDVDSIEVIKDFALKTVRERFPEVEIPEKR